MQEYNGRLAGVGFKKRPVQKKIVAGSDGDQLILCNQCDRPLFLFAARFIDEKIKRLKSKKQLAFEHKSLKLYHRQA